MNEPTPPKLSKSRIGFGKYSPLQIQTIYTGTQNIPRELYQVWLNAWACYETTPKDFSCSNLEELEIVLESIDGKLLGKEVMRKMVEARFNELIYLETYRVFIGKRDGTTDMEDESNYRENIDVYSNSYMTDKESYKSTLLKRMTHLDCKFFKFEFAKQYATITCTNSDATINKNFNFHHLLGLVVEKNSGVSHWSQGYNNPFMVDLHKMQTPYYSHGEQNILVFGAPEYLDWALREGKIFLRPETIEKLEKLDVNTVPQFRIEMISDDLCKWSLVNNKSKFKFSDDAKEVSRNLCNSYYYDLKRFEDWEEDGSKDDSDDYKPYWKYTEQEFIDDAFGGEADAYWNID